MYTGLLFLVLIGGITSTAHSQESVHKDYFFNLPFGKGMDSVVAAIKNTPGLVYVSSQGAQCIARIDKREGVYKNVNADSIILTIYLSRPKDHEAESKGMAEYANMEATLKMYYPGAKQYNEPPVNMTAAKENLMAALQKEFGKPVRENTDSQFCRSAVVYKEREQDILDSFLLISHGGKRCKEPFYFEVLSGTPIRQRKYARPLKSNQ